MHIKTILGIVLVTGIVGGGIYFAMGKFANKSLFDFGDAPDGKPTWYEETGGFAKIGNFPSLLKSNGARIKKTDEVWIGNAVDMEKDSMQVNTDKNDDGLLLETSSCQQSKAYFMVHIKEPGKISGTAYLNLWADWNKDGKWNGSDECAKEWAVENMSIDLSQQTEEIKVYIPEFTAGKNTENIWYRGSITVNEQMSESSTGEFKSGEVEDYGPVPPEDWLYYGFYCQPNPLKIKHGEKGEIKIVPDLFSEPITGVDFFGGFQNKDEKRNITLKDRTISFESSAKDVDLPKRTVPHAVPLWADFGPDISIPGVCWVLVEHDDVIITETPKKENQPKPTPTKSTPYIETKQGGNTNTETQNNVPVNEESQSPSPTPSPTPTQTDQGVPGSLL